MRGYVNIHVREDSGVKDRLKEYAFNNGRITLTAAIEKLLENQPAKQ